ncbi:MAG: sulfotransferase [Deltaproteobacteria bacterium]|nr:sulfotransferase [Deltaproteobacteria bacterium]
MAVILPSARSSTPRSLRTAFLVGAPRCGTTFLAKTLAAHPDVCFSKPKETHFFVRDAIALPTDEGRHAFLSRYFGHLGDAETLLVEGSPLQLRDPAAIDRLQAFDPETRFVVAIRSPIAMIHSFHARLVFLLDEDERDFARAWDLQAARARGEQLPKRCRDVASLQYRSMASLGTQLARLIDQVGRARVHVVVFDDVAADPVKAYRALLEFLELPDDGRTRFSKKNENREFRHAWAQTWVMNPPRFVTAWLEARQRRGRNRPEWIRNLRRRLKRWNTQSTQREALSPAMRARLAAELEPEIEQLEALLGRDFSSWR